MNKVLIEFEDPEDAAKFVALMDDILAGETWGLYFIQTS